MQETWVQSLGHGFYQWVGKITGEGKGYPLQYPVLATYKDDSLVLWRARYIQLCLILVIEKETKYSEYPMPEISANFPLGIKVVVLPQCLELSQFYSQNSFLEAIKIRRDVIH